MLTQPIVTPKARWWNYLLVVVFTIASLFYLFEYFVMKKPALSVVMVAVLIYGIIGILGWRQVDVTQSGRWLGVYFAVQIALSTLVSLLILPETNELMPSFWHYPLMFQAAALPVLWRWVIWLILWASHLVFQPDIVMMPSTDVIFSSSLYFAFGLAGYMVWQERILRQEKEGLLRYIEQQRQREIAHHEKINHLRVKFVRSATHDLKNPLNILMGYLDLLKNDETIVSNHLLQKYMSYMERSTQRMHYLIVDMLDLLEVQSEIQPKFTPLSLNALLQEVVDDFQRSADDKGLSLKLQLPDYPVIRALDANRFRRLVDNLVSNAIKYTPSGGIIGLHLYQQGSETLIDVRDTGMGIPENSIPALFDAFYRVPDKSHNQIEGTGLGLAIVKAIADQHQARIQIESVVNQGTTIRVIMPEHNQPVRMVTGTQAAD